MVKDDPREKILEATLNVLVETGFSNLSFSKIADEADISKSLISYHFNSKKELVSELLEWMTEISLSEKREKKPGETDLDYLMNLLLPEGEFERKIQRSILELGTMSPHNDDIAERIREMNRRFRTEIEDALPEVEDSQIKSELFLSTIEGIIIRREVLDEEIDVESLKNELRDLAG